MSRYVAVERMKEALINDYHENFLPSEIVEIRDLAAEVYRPKWIPFTFDEDGLNCRLPYEDEEILVSSKYGIWIDTFMRDKQGYYLDSERDFKGLAWMPLPEPYKED